MPDLLVGWYFVYVDFVLSIVMHGAVRMTLDGICNPVRNVHAF